MWKYWFQFLDLKKISISWHCPFKGVMKVILVLLLSIRRSHSLLTQHKVCVIPGWLGLSGNLDKCLARICKRLWSPGIDSEESIPPACVAWRAGTTNRVVVSARQDGNRFLGSLKGLRIRAQDFRNDAQNTVHWFNAEFQLLKFTLCWDHAACYTLQISGYSLKKKKNIFFLYTGSLFMVGLRGAKKKSENLGREALYF